LPELTALNQVEEIEGQTHKNNFYHTLEVVDNICPNTDDVCVAVLLHDIGKAPNALTKNKDGLFMDMNFLEENGEKIFERLHMPLNQKNEICSKNGNDEFATYRFISRNSNRFCCSPFGI
jgi:tRNA nucleotidyltransferase (CCA-adding enzyme)